MPLIHHPTKYSVVATLKIMLPIINRNESDLTIIKIHHFHDTTEHLHHVVTNFDRQCLPPSPSQDDFIALEIKINRSVKINELFTFGHLSMHLSSAATPPISLSKIARCTTLTADAAAMVTSSLRIHLWARRCHRQTSVKT